MEASEDTEADELPQVPAVKEEPRTCCVSRVLLGAETKPPSCVFGT